MKELTHLTIAEARKGLKEKKFSAKDLTQAHLDQMAQTRDLNAYITETPELALKAAEEADTRIAKNAMRALEGIPLAIKDLFCTEGVKTTAGSKILENFVPPYESTVSGNLLNAGAVMLGKTNLDEFAMGSSNLTSAFGPVKSPWAIKGDTRAFIPGGSSGGSAAAVAACAAMAATASDTGGSIRQPASFCGLVGIKPTYGLCSRYGIVAFASSLDQAGPLTKDVRDAAIMLEIMASYDPKDATSVDIKIPSYEQELEKGVKGLKIGIPKEYRVEGMNQEVEELWNKGISWLKDQGAEIVDISLPHTQYALATYYIIAPAEASSNLARYDGVRYGKRVDADAVDELYQCSRAEGFGQEVKRRILIGTYALSAGYYEAYYLKAQKVRRLITEDFIKAFKTVDLILTPTVPSAAFAFGEEPKDPISMYMNDILTVTVNLAGLPAISVPAGLTKQGLPLGLQLIGASFQENRVLQGAYAIEKAAAFTKQVEELKKAS
jgi:aspartyl-tRNA(Asn)/glutamyl-tRNA(Gln) amidotransferase subunit A